MGFGSRQIIHKGASQGQKKISGVLLSGQVSRSGAVFYNSVALNPVTTGAMDIGDLVSVPDGSPYWIILESFGPRNVQVHSESSQTLTFEARITKNPVSDPDVQYQYTRSGAEWPWTAWGNACNEGDFVDFSIAPSRAFGGVMGTDTHQLILGFTSVPSSFASCQPRGPYTGSLLFWFPDLDNPGQLVFGDLLLNPNIIIPQGFLKSEDSLIPIEDTFADASTPDTPKPGTDRLNCRDNNLGFLRESFLKFDLSGIPAVRSAVLTLESRVTRPDDADIELCKTSNAWDEDTLTWNNRPAAGEVINNFLIPTDAPAGEIYQVELASGINDMLEFGSTVSFLMRNTTSSDETFSFHSSKQEVGLKPTLEIEYYKK